MAGPENVLRDYDRIQKRLGEGSDGDPRLASGVPRDQRVSDIEFIQMSGLVRPSPPTARDDLDPFRPVSFFEKGVADVDADMAPGVLEDRATANQEIGPIQRTQTAMSHLRDIIADLTKDSPTAAPDPVLMAALDPPGKPSDTTNAASAPEGPRLFRPAPVLSGHNAHLVEAERLLDELEPAPVKTFDAAPPMRPFSRTSPEAGPTPPS